MVWRRRHGSPCFRERRSSGPVASMTSAMRARAGMWTAAGAAGVGAQPGDGLFRHSGGVLRASQPALGLRERGPRPPPVCAPPPWTSPFAKLDDPGRNHARKPRRAYRLGLSTAPGGQALRARPPRCPHARRRRRSFLIFSFGRATSPASVWSSRPRRAPAKVLTTDASALTI
jgi:hypothetical protein